MFIPSLGESRGLRISFSLSLQTQNLLLMSHTSDQNPLSGRAAAGATANVCGRLVPPRSDLSITLLTPKTQSNSQLSRSHAKMKPKNSRGQFPPGAEREGEVKTNLCGTTRSAFINHLSSELVYVRVRRCGNLQIGEFKAIML